MARYFDNTRISNYKTCPRYYYLRHKRHLVRVGIAAPLVFGLSWHEAMDVLWKFSNSDKTDQELLAVSHAAFLRCWEENDFPAEPSLEQLDKLKFRTPMVAMEMLYCYINERRDWIAAGEILSIEQPFAVPLSKEEEDLWYIGRLDKVFRPKGESIYIIEHKTTSAYAKIGGFRSDFIRSFSPDSQIDGYSHSGHMLYGDELRGVFIDAALVHKTVHDKFKLIPIDRQFAALDIWLKETRDWIERIENEEEQGKRQDYMGYPKNTGSCNNYGGCTYLDICKFVHNPQDTESFSGYEVKPWEPFDILKIEQLGMEKEDENV